MIYQGGEAATQAPVKRPTAGSNPAPGACPHRLAGQGRRPLKAETRVRIPVGTPRARVHWMDNSSSKRAFAGSSPAGRTHAPAVRLERTPRYERGERRFESSRGHDSLDNDCSRKHLARLPGRLPGEAGSIPVGSATLARLAGASSRSISGRIGFDPRRQDESAWRKRYTRRAQTSLSSGFESRSAHAIVAELAYAAGRGPVPPTGREGSNPSDRTTARLGSPTR